MLSQPKAGQEELRDAPGINSGTFHYSGFKDRMPIITGCFYKYFQ